MNSRNKDRVRPQVGEEMIRPDAWTKVTGQEKYAADYYGDDFLWAGVKRSDTAHGILKSIDLEKARRVDGVFAVLTHQDVPAPNRQGIVHKDQPVLVDHKVRRIGDALALVLAENRIALKKALSLIEAELEPLAAVFDPEKALEPGAPLIHEQSPGNLLAEIKLEKGRGLQGFDDSWLVVKGRFEVPRQEHAYLETEAGWAYTDENGVLVVVASTQSPYRDVSEISAALGLDPEKVRVVAPYLGGGFGGKDGMSVQTLLALAVLHSRGRPVKMWWDREESFLAGVKRLPARLDYRLGALPDGKLVALSCRLLMDAGAYDHLCGEVLALAMEHAAGPYLIDHVSLEGRCVYTNNPAGGPFRGFGVPQVTAALEQMMDIMAGRLGLDPLAFRNLNAVRRSDVNSVGVTLTLSTGLTECLKQAARHSWWQEREDWKKQAGPFKKRGVGAVCLWHGAGYGPVVADYANAKIELTGKGSFLVDAAVADMGQGNAGACLQIAGDILCQETGNIDLVLPDTKKTLPSCSSAGSRTTYTYARALIDAAETMKKRLLEKASVLMMTASAEEFVLGPGLVRHIISGREIPLSQLARAMPAQERVATAYWRAPVARDKVKVEMRGTFGLPHILFSYAVHLALVEVDELTGAAVVVKYLAVTDGGRVLNPPVYEQQIQGGVVQGLGYALCEDFRVKDGRGLTPNLATYIIPTSLDVPVIESKAVEIQESTGPFGAKGIGEIPIDGPLPAVANAVADALGHRLFQAPLTPERILGSN